VREQGHKQSEELPMIEIRDQSALPSVLAACLPCLLCGKPAVVGALFVPNDQDLVGAPPGKLRVFRYSLCRRCLRKKGATAAERRILDTMAAQNRVN